MSKLLRAEKIDRKVITILTHKYFPCFSNLNNNTACVQPELLVYAKIENQIKKFQVGGSMDQPREKYGNESI